MLSLFFKVLIQFRNLIVETQTPWKGKDLVISNKIMGLILSTFNFFEVLVIFSPSFQGGRRHVLFLGKLFVWMTLDLFEMLLPGFLYGKTDLETKKRPAKRVSYSGNPEGFDVVWLEYISLKMKSLYINLSKIYVGEKWQP